MLPAQLIDEVEALRKEGLAITLTEADGMANILIENHAVVSMNYSKRSTELLLRLALSYPNGRPDMFWTDEDLLLKGGGVPKSADAIEPWLGKRRRRFSWHLTAWNPGVDNLRTYLEFVNNRLAKAE